MFFNVTAANQSIQPRHANAPVNIAIVLPSVTRGGAEMWQERIASQLTGVDVVVLAPRGSHALDFWRRRGDHTVELSVGRRGRGAARAVREICGQLRADRPDVVIAHGVKAALLSVAATALAGGRTVWVRHDDSYPRITWALNRLTDAEIVNSYRQRNIPSDATVIEPPLAGEPLGREEAQLALGLGKTDSARYVMTTRLVPYKGVDVAIAALAQAAHAELHVFGLPDDAYPDELQRLQAKACELSVAERVHFHAPRDDAWRYLAGFDGLLMLTRSDRNAHVTEETFGLAAYEAVAAGIPVIATTQVALALAGAGYAVDPSDTAEVAAAMQLVSEPTQRQLCARAGEELLAQHPLSARAAAAKFRRVIARVANRPGAGEYAPRPGRGMPPLSVVTTVLNEGPELRQLIAQIREQLGDEDEFVIVDGGSHDGTYDVARAAADADERIIAWQVPGAGISQGRNYGIQRTHHELIVCTDAGCTPDTGWLDAFRAAARAEPDVGLFTGCYVVSADTRKHRALAAAGYPTLQELAQPTAWQRGYGKIFGGTFRADMPTGRSIAFTRRAWAVVGGFPEGVATGEDVTFGQHIATLFRCQLVRDAVVCWQQRPTVGATARMYFRYGEGSIHAGNRRLLLRDGARAAAYLVSALALARGGRIMRALTLAAGGVYLSVPWNRAWQLEPSIRLLALTPGAVALRDLAKVCGAVDAAAGRGWRWLAKVARS